MTANVNNYKWQIDECLEKYVQDPELRRYYVNNWIHTPDSFPIFYEQALIFSPEEYPQHSVALTHLAQEVMGRIKNHILNSSEPDMKKRRQIVVEVDGASSPLMPTVIERFIERGVIFDLGKHTDRCFCLQA